MPTTKRRPPLPLLLALPAAALVLSGIITAINVGAGASDFAVRWLVSFLTALPVFPIALLVAIAVERLLDRFTSSLPTFVKRSLASVISACVIEFCVTTVVTWSNLGTDSLFGPLWLAAFFRSLPFGLTVALVMNFVIKPRYIDEVK